MRGSPFHALRKLFTSGWFVLGVAFLVLILAMGVGRLFVRRAAFNHEIASLEEKKSLLSSGNQSYRNQLSYLSTESFLEQEAREKFGQKRPGETAVYVEENSLEELVEISVNSNKYSKPQLWWIYFFEADTYAEIEEARSNAL
jgi:hypothetical protein